MFIIEAREHDLMFGARVIIEQKNDRAVVHAQLTKGTPLHEALQALLCRLRARIDVARNVVCAPEAKEPQEGVVGTRRVIVLRQERL
jgi:hypothetical protein